MSKVGNVKEQQTQVKQINKFVHLRTEMNVFRT